MEKIILDNNIPLVLKENKNTPRHALCFYFKITEPEKKAGIYTILNRLFLQGTKTRDAHTLAQELDENAIDCYSEMKQDFIRFKLQCLNEDFAKGLEILSDIIKNSTFEDFEKEVIKLKGEIQAELARIAAEEEKNRQQNGGATIITGNPSSSGYIFPVAGLSKANIRNKSYPSYAGHTGVDVNINVTGKSVVAVKDGTVVTSTALKNSNGSYRSYGEYVVINHHDGTMTLYAHMLAGSRRVSAGQTVKQGQVIGTVGSTGNSSGTHLHFEVRVNGRPVNPLPYLP